MLNLKNAFPPSKVLTQEFYCTFCNLSQDATYGLRGPHFERKRSSEGRSLLTKRAKATLQTQI